jgi:hypothetical protein
MGRIKFVKKPFNFIFFATIAILQLLQRINNGKNSVVGSDDRRGWGNGRGLNERITGACSVGDDRIFRNGMTENVFLRR